MSGARGGGLVRRRVGGLRKQRASQKPSWPLRKPLLSTPAGFSEALLAFKKAPSKELAVFQDAPPPSEKAAPSRHGRVCADDPLPWLVSVQNWDMKSIDP